MLKQKRFTIINIAGLAIGLCCFILIMLWVQDELSYDRFHQNADRIYLAIRTDQNVSMAATSKMLAPALKDEFPQVINATSFIQTPESVRIFLKYKEKGFEQTLALVDDDFFKIFSFEYMLGDPHTALASPNSVVITESIARKYFGDRNPMGETMDLSMLGKTSLMKVTGVLKDIPHNSHIQRQIFTTLPFFIKTYHLEQWSRWGNQQSNTYILTRENTDLNVLEKNIADYERKQLPNQDLKDLGYTLFPLKKLHLYAKDIKFFSSTGDIHYVYIFIAIAGLVLLIAIVNYVNLSNALSLRRAKSIGIHKVVGAQRRNLAWQHAFETFTLTFISLLLGLLFAQLLLPVINHTTGKTLSIQPGNLDFSLTLLVTLLVTGAVSSLYPAILISGFQPIQVLKGRLISGKRGNHLQKSLITLQFAVSIIIIICTMVVYNQLHYFQNTNLGYDKENIVCINIKGDIYSQYDAFKSKLLDNSNIIASSLSEPLEASSLSKTGGVDWPGKQGNFSTWILNTDEDFGLVYKIDMQKGRFFSEQFATDKTDAYIVNPPAAKEMGLDSPVGTDLTIWGRKGQIIGLTDDFHFSSLHDQIEPLIIRIPNPEEENLYYRTLSVRVASNSLPKSVQYLKETWHSFYPDQPFDYYFMDNYLNNSYQAEMRMSELFKYFSLLAIFIACLGLWGLTALTIEQKVKDIGIYKVLGANIDTIIFNLSKGYFKWILISNIIAWPIAYFAMNKWLEQYAYRVHMGWPVFVLPGIAALVIAMLTISWLTIRAATADPVEALRYE